MTSALQLPAFGEPAEVVRLASQPELHAGDGEVLVAIEAASINPADLHLIRGFYGVRPQLPAPLGAEGVGRVIGVGSPADNALVGRRVVVLFGHGHGTWAQHAVVDRRNVLAVADDADPLQLAMVGVPITALLLLRSYVTLVEGDWVAQTGANSAVGQHIIKLAKLVGVRTLNVVRRASAAEQVRLAGGDRVIVYGTDFSAQLHNVLDGQELVLVLDSVGGLVPTELAHKLRFGGKLVSFGSLGGQPTALAVRDDLIYRDVSHHGFWIENWLRNSPRETIEGAYQEVVDHVGSGQLTADIDQTFHLERYAEALNRAQQYKRPGKVLFTP
jgi:NADPH:quinone reductase-like Zn-dependent oxidoreductase